MIGLLALFCSLLILRAQNQPPAPAFAKLDSTVMQLMSVSKVPGLSLVLIRDGKPAYSQSYGLIKADSTQKVDANTVFEAASLTKPTFAYAVLQLVEEGKLDLDKPLYEYLPYPDVASDERYKKITARLVLSHRTGFPNWRRNRQSSELSMRFAPNERFGYSGEGFVYLQKVVEKMTGQAINDFMEERVLKPLGMAHSGYIWKPFFEANVAQPHNEEGKAEQKGKPRQANMAYSLHTTANDYARFVMALLNATGLKKTTISQMLSPQGQLPKRFSGSDTLAPYSFWGLGVGLEQTPSDTYFWHWGDNGAFKCFMMVSATRKEGLVYFANGSNGLDFADEFVRQTIGGQHPAFGFLGINWQEEVKKRGKKH
jgi:CubicO group peptidase (beta-lactamase class C family)